MSEEYNFGPDILTLEDEEGREHRFEVIDTLEKTDSTYYALIPVFDHPEDSLEDDGELVILKSEMDGDEEFLALIEDEEEFSEISQEFMSRLEDTYEIQN